MARLLSLFCTFLSFVAFADGNRPQVLVSVTPYRYFVSKIAGDFVAVETIVPAGASGHTYEPTPRQMVSAAKADIWFRLGEQFETKALQALRSAHPEMKVVDLREGISLLHDRCSHSHGCGDDLHIWLSPPLAQIQSRTIANALALQYPEQAPLFEKNLADLLASLQALDQFIETTLAPIQNRVLMVSHPAYAYFCQQYHFTQIPIEFEGKDPTAKQLTQLLKEGKRRQVKAIFTQPQYSDKAAKLIAEQLGALIISIDPYSEDYDTILRKLTELIRDHS